MNSKLVSVVVVSNRLKMLNQSIEHIINQSYPNFEIIIVWNGSLVNLNNIKSIYKNKKNIKIINDGSNNVAKGRNIGIRYSKGDYVAFTDDDCVVDKDWLRYLVLKFSNNKGIGGVGSIRDVKNKDSYLAVLWQLAYIRIGDMDIKYNYINNNNIYICTSSALFKKDILKKLNGFDENLRSGEDTDISLRIKELGYSLMMEPKAVVYHYHPVTWRGMINQQIWYGVGGYQMLKKYKRSMLEVSIDKLINGILLKYIEATLFCIVKKEYKNLIIFPLYAITLEIARYTGYVISYYKDKKNSIIRHTLFRA